MPRESAVPRDPTSSRIAAPSRRPQPPRAILSSEHVASEARGPGTSRGGASTVTRRFAVPGSSTVPYVITTPRIGTVPRAITTPRTGTVPHAITTPRTGTVPRAITASRTGTVPRGVTAARSMPATHGATIARGPRTVPRGGGIARGASTVPRGPSVVPRGPSTVPHGPSISQGPTTSRGPTIRPHGPTTPTGPSVIPRGGTRARGGGLARGSASIACGGALARGPSTVPRGPTTPRGPNRHPRGPSAARGPKVIPHGVTVPRGPSIPHGTALSGSIQQALIEKFWVALMVYDTSTGPTVTENITSESESSSSSESESDSEIDSDLSFGDGEEGNSFALTNRMDLFAVVRQGKHVTFKEGAELIGDISLEGEGEEGVGEHLEVEEKDRRVIEGGSEAEEAEIKEVIAVTSKETTNKYKREKEEGEAAAEENKCTEEEIQTRENNIAEGEALASRLDYQDAAEEKDEGLDTNTLENRKDFAREEGQEDNIHTPEYKDTKINCESVVKQDSQNKQIEENTNNQEKEEVNSKLEKYCKDGEDTEEKAKVDDARQEVKDHAKDEEVESEDNEERTEIEQKELESEYEKVENEDKERTEEEEEGGVDDICFEECLKIAILGVVAELPEGWLLVRENTGELVSSVLSLVEVQPRPLPALTAALTALTSQHTSTPCDKGAITVLHNAHLLLYVALKLSCTRASPPPPTSSSILHHPHPPALPQHQKLILRALQEMLNCEGSFDRLMVVVLLGSAAPGQGCGWYYETEDESEKIRDLRFLLDHIRLLPQCSVSEVVSAPLWWCGSSSVVVAALADSPGLLLTLLQYGAGGTHLHHYHYSKCCTNGVYLAITYLVRRLEGQLCQPFSLDPPYDNPEEKHPPQDNQAQDNTERKDKNEDKTTKGKQATDLLTLAGDSNTASCLRYLLRAVPRVPAKLLRDQLVSSDPPTLLPRPCCMDPPSLRHLARAATRDLLRSRDLLPHILSSLSLPHTLRDYLNLLTD